MRSINVQTITGTSPASASTAAIGTANGLAAHDWFLIDATIIGGTAGTVDAWLQRKVEGVDAWRDWIRFPLVSAATTKHYSVQVGSGQTIYEVSQGTTASPGTPTIAANTAIGGHPGDKVRLMVTAGAGTTAGATQTVYISGWSRRV